jgi:sulfur-carrier protein
MKIKSHYLGLVKSYTSKSQDEVELQEGAILSDLLNKLAREFGKQFTQEIYEPNAKDVKPTFSVTVNGVFIGQLNGVDTKLKDGDTVIIMPLVTGG